MSKEIKPQSTCKRFKGKRLGTNEYWSPNLFTSKKIEIMDMDSGFIEEEFIEEEFIEEEFQEVEELRKLDGE